VRLFSKQQFCACHHNPLALVAQVYFPSAIYLLVMEVTRCALGQYKLQLELLKYTMSHS
jgi:hypothetical protein